MNWLRRLFRRKPEARRATLILTLKYGTKVDVGSILCQQCQNFFFAPQMEYEKPSFCPFCGLKFQGYTRDDLAIEDQIGS